MSRVESYPATVTKIEEDPKLGRIFVKCLALSGDETTEYPDPIDPVLDWGWFYIPDVGEEVEIEVVVEDSHVEDVRQQASIDEQRPRWRGKRFISEEGEQPRPPNAKFTEENYGKRRGFATPAGHVVMFDDTSGKESILISWAQGDSVASIEIDKDGSLILTDKQGNVIKMDATSNNIDVTAANEIHLNAAGDADNFLVRGDDHYNWINTVLKVWADTHVHPTAFGPSGPPVSPLSAPPNSNLSSKAKVK